MIELVATDKCVFEVPNPITMNSTMHLLRYKEHYFKEDKTEAAAERKQSPQFFKTSYFLIQSELYEMNTNPDVACSNSERAPPIIISSSSAGS